MKTYKTSKNISPSPAVIALGCFDGVHIGHRAVIEEARRLALSLGIESAVWTFEEPPKNFFIPNSAPLITSFEGKQRLMDEMGIDIFYCIPFDNEIKNTPARLFLEEYVLGAVNAKHIVCGFDYRFGKNAEGNTSFLKAFCAEKDIGLTVLPPTTVDGITVSSTLIRDEVANGRMENAARMLGRNYSIIAPVINGQALARRLGFPTANQPLSEKLLIPKRGVYISRAYIDGCYRYGITNVGIRPTVRTHELCMETHFFDYSSDLYGKELTVEFLSFIREETEFPSVEAMAEQINKDIAYAKEKTKEY